MFESFIMENLLTATNTFHFEDDGAVNIYTCNYNGKHEPQQIDNIFSSDNSLRSMAFDSSATGKPIGWDSRDRIGYNSDVRLF